MNAIYLNKLISKKHAIQFIANAAYSASTVKLSLLAMAALLVSACSSNSSSATVIEEQPETFTIFPAAEASKMETLIPTPNGDKYYPIAKFDSSYVSLAQSSDSLIVKDSVLYTNDPILIGDGKAIFTSMNDLNFKLNGKPFSPELIVDTVRISAKEVQGSELPGIKISAVGDLELKLPTDLMPSSLFDADRNDKLIKFVTEELSKNDVDPDVADIFVQFLLAFASVGMKEEVTLPISFILEPLLVLALDTISIKDNFVIECDDNENLVVSNGTNQVVKYSQDQNFLDLHLKTKDGVIDVENIPVHSNDHTSFGQSPIVPGLILGNPVPTGNALSVNQINPLSGPGVNLTGTTVSSAIQLNAPSDHGVNQPATMESSAIQALTALTANQLNITPILGPINSDPYALVDIQYETSICDPTGVRIMAYTDDVTFNLRAFDAETMISTIELDFNTKLPDPSTETEFVQSLLNYLSDGRYFHYDYRISKTSDEDPNEFDRSEVVTELQKLPGYSYEQVNTVGGHADIYRANYGITRKDDAEELVYAYDSVNPQSLLDSVVTQLYDLLDITVPKIVVSRQDEGYTYGLSDTMDEEFFSQIQSSLKSSDSVMELKLATLAIDNDFVRSDQKSDVINLNDGQFEISSDVTTYTTSDWSSDSLSSSTETYTNSIKSLGFIGDY